MKKPAISDAQIIAALLREEGGVPTTLLCWELGISRDIFDTWRQTYAEPFHEAIADRETDTLLARLRDEETETIRIKNMQTQKRIREQKLKAAQEKKNAAGTNEAGKNEAGKKIGPENNPDPDPA